MKWSDYIERINKINNLISSCKTGTPKQFAEKLGIGESRLYEIVEDLRNEKVPIAYSRKRESFYYTKPFLMQANFVLKELNDEELKNISGGFNPSDFSGVGAFSFALSMAVDAGNDTNLFKKEWVLF